MIYYPYCSKCANFIYGVNHGWLCSGPPSAGYDGVSCEYFECKEEEGEL